MASVNWSSALLPLVGVVVGAGASIAAQWLNERTTRWRMRDERASALRLERKEAMLAYLAAVQPLEVELENRALDGDDDRRLSRLQPLMHQIWLLQKQIDLICDGEVRESCFDFTHRLHQAVWDWPDIQKWHEHVTGVRSWFLATGRAELSA